MTRDATATTSQQEGPGQAQIPAAIGPTGITRRRALAVPADLDSTYGRHNACAGKWSLKIIAYALILAQGFIVLGGESAESYPGTQGDPLDTQWDFELASSA